jgi:ABC-type antimicrobial peptide transport system permease subunit
VHSRDGISKWEDHSWSHWEGARKYAHPDDPSAFCRHEVTGRPIVTASPGVGKSFLGCALAQKACRDGHLVLYTIPAVRHAVQSIDPNLPLSNVRTQVEQIDQTLFQERLFAKLSSFFGLLALILACIGLYGIMSYAVARRTNEIGIRMALGARREDILRKVLREAFVLVFAGMAIGIPIALGALRLISSMLFGLKPTDPVTLAGATAFMLAVAAFAGYLPARRASRVDPMVALRYE